MKKFLVLFIVLFSTYAWAETYYVATDGTDEASCVTAPPTTNCATAQYIIDNVDLTGHTLYYRGGSYTNNGMDVAANDEGTAGDHIIFAGYPGETVTITTSTDTYVVDVRARDYLTFRNLNFVDSGTGGSIILLNNSTNILIEDCTFNHTNWQDGTEYAAIKGLNNSNISGDYTIRNCTFTGRGFGINLPTGGFNLDGVYIHGNTFNYAGTADGDTDAIKIKVQTAGNAFNLYIYDNYIADTHRRGILIGSDSSTIAAGTLPYNVNITNNVIVRAGRTAIGIQGTHPTSGTNLIASNIIHQAGYQNEDTINAVQLSYCHNMTVEDNYITGTTTNAAGDGNGIILDWLQVSWSYITNGVTVRRNYVADNTSGSGERSAGISAYRAKNCIIHNNISVGNSVGIKQKGETSTGNEFYHNTMRDNVIGFDISNLSPQAILRNNLVLNSTDYGIMVYDRGGAPAVPDEDYSYVYGSGIADYHDPDTLGFSAGSNSYDTTDGDPLVTNTHRPKWNSPLKDVGELLSLHQVGLKDYLGNTRICGSSVATAKPDIGAIEFCKGSTFPIFIFDSGGSITGDWWANPISEGSYLTIEDGSTALTLEDGSTTLDLEN